MKQVNYISDDLEIDLQETAELIYDYLKEKKVNRKTLTEIIKELKKLSSDLLEIT
jgi:phage-related protein